MRIINGALNHDIGLFFARPLGAPALYLSARY